MIGGVYSRFCNTVRRSTVYRDCFPIECCVKLAIRKKGYTICVFYSFPYIHVGTGVFYSLFASVLLSPRTFTLLPSINPTPAPPPPPPPRPLPQPSFLRPIEAERILQSLWLRAQIKTSHAHQCRIYTLGSLCFSAYNPLAELPSAIVPLHYSRRGFILLSRCATRNPFQRPSPPPHSLSLAHCSLSASPKCIHKHSPVYPQFLQSVCLIFP